MKPLQVHLHGVPTLSQKDLMAWGFHVEASSQMDFAVQPLSCFLVSDGQFYAAATEPFSNREAQQPSGTSTGRPGKVRRAGSWDYRSAKRFQERDREQLPDESKAVRDFLRHRPVSTATSHLWLVPQRVFLQRERMGSMRPARQRGLQPWQS